MNIFLHFVLVGWMLISSVNGASVASALPGINCSVADGYSALTCTLRLQDFGSKIRELVDNDGESDEFIKSCDAIDTCLNSLRNCKEYSENLTIRAGDMVKAYCDVVNYLSHDFSSCGSKLEANKSECYEKWEPFLDGSELKDKKKMEESCENFFGKDECLKNEIIENCSQDEWEQLRDHFIQLDENLMKQCNLKKMLEFKSSEYNV
ncbi:hypothetical protein GCK72_018944 [Caenorhabditis remanei]|uniref:T20D4.11-like domain-containing protein n=1 Tax=Caenorhabditis remanei TaxID=31234 RepID=A0A6A5GD96_CAERE|nr:hypothetical protein GCK72_018944 [Caenorhabditis remanei]KAF1752389.1 hypothetical protein GCK72_018944 [Caenorhabditis remanei]